MILISYQQFDPVTAREGVLRCIEASVKCIFTLARFALNPLGRRCLRSSLRAAAAVLAVALGAGSIRLLPWLLAEEVPLEVCWPFARALAAVAMETGFLVGV